MDSRSRRVLLLIKGLGLGGAERHLVDLAKHLIGDGLHVKVAYLLPNKDALVEELNASGVHVQCLEYAGALGRVAAFVRLLRLCRSYRPDVLHAHLPVPGTFARLLKPVFGFRLVYTEHNVYQRLNLASRLLSRLLNWLDDARISCSSAVQESLPWRSQVIENGIAVPEASYSDAHRASTRSRMGVPEGAIVILCVANLVKKKNHALLIRAFADVFRGLGEEAKTPLLWLVGQDGTERNVLGSLAVQLGVDRNVLFAGPQLDPRPFMAAADVYVMSSDFEGLPIALLEAMSFGLPAVVTNAGGMGRVVNDAGCGVVVNVGDQRGLAEGLHSLASDASKRSDMGRRARSVLKNRYSLRRCVEQIRLVYFPKGNP